MARRRRAGGLSWSSSTGRRRLPDCVAAVAAREWGPWGAGVGRGWARRASRTGGSWDARHVRTAASLAKGRPFQLRRTAASLRR